MVIKDDLILVLGRLDYSIPKSQSVSFLKPILPTFQHCFDLPAILFSQVVTECANKAIIINKIRIMQGVAQTLHKRQPR